MQLPLTLVTFLIGLSAAAPTGHDPKIINNQGKAVAVPQAMVKRDDLAPTLISSAPTSTSTIFTASSTPTTEFGETINFPISSKQNPLATEGVKVSSSLSNPIKPSSLSQAVVVTQSLVADNTAAFVSVSTSTTEISLPSDITDVSNEVSDLKKRATTQAVVKVDLSNANGFSGDLFQPISVNDLTATFKRKALPLAIPAGVSNGNTKYQTNKFYTNFIVGDQTSMVWSHPFGLNYIKQTYFGLAIQSTRVSQRVFGYTNTNNDKFASFYFNPIKISEMIVSSTKFTSASNTKINVSGMKINSVDVKLSTDGKATTNYIHLPIVQGMGFVTSIYHGDLVPRINSGVGFKTFAAEQSSTLTNNNILKYRATLFNGVQYLVYVKLPKGSKTSDFSLKASDSNTIKGSKAIDGLIIQYAIAPLLASQVVYYDQAAGMYSTECKVKAHGYGGTSAELVFQYRNSGSSISKKPLVFMLPHIVEAADANTKKALTGITLPSTTKGEMSQFSTEEIRIVENLNTNVQFLPWVQEMGNKAPIWTSAQLKLIATVANKELSVDIMQLLRSQNSNYFAGKILDKYAYILYVVSDILGDEKLTKSTLEIMKTAFNYYRTNKQFYPLMYDTKFGGITSTAYDVSNDPNADFGSSYYNDHHYHYGYFIHAAALIGYVDLKYGGTWAKSQQPWVNALVRDVANPSPSDPYFPVFRLFDWFQGHSWASGLFDGGDGRNEESSSEDYHFSYAIKLWGKVTRNKRMESYGDLMLAVMARAMNKYMLFSKNNQVEPSQIIGNKVSGILFENKIAYTTYFGSPDKNPEYVHGIHMLPITPASSLIRGSAYVKEEWDSQISTFINKVKSGWTGILRLNQALYDAKSSYAFFSSSSWTDDYLDNGQSRTWGLAFSAGVMNALAA